MKHLFEYKDLPKSTRKSFEASETPFDFFPRKVVRLVDDKGRVTTMSTSPERQLVEYAILGTILNNVQPGVHYTLSGKCLELFPELYRKWHSIILSGTTTDMNGKYPTITETPRHPNPRYNDHNRIFVEFVRGCLFRNTSGYMDDVTYPMFKTFDRSTGFGDPIETYTDSPCGQKITIGQPDDTFWLVSSISDRVRKQISNDYKDYADELKNKWKVLWKPTSWYRNAGLFALCKAYIAPIRKSIAADWKRSLLFLLPALIVLILVYPYTMLALATKYAAIPAGIYYLFMIVGMIDKHVNPKYPKPKSIENPDNRLR